MATRILQPSPGADTHLDSGSPTTNMSGLTNLQNYANTSSAYRRVLLRFDLATLGLSGDEVVSGFIVLWNDGGDGGSLPASFDVHRVTSDWIASEATWNDRKAGTPWGSPGGDHRKPNAPGSLPVSERVAATVFWFPPFADPEPGLLEQYIEAAEKVVRHAQRLPALVKDPEAPLTLETRRMAARGPSR